MSHSSPLLSYFRIITIWCELKDWLSGLLNYSSFPWSFTVSSVGFIPKKDLEAFWRNIWLYRNWCWTLKTWLSLYPHNASLAWHLEDLLRLRLWGFSCVLLWLCFIIKDLSETFHKHLILVLQISLAYSVYRCCHSLDISLPIRGPELHH